MQFKGIHGYQSLEQCEYKQASATPEAGYLLHETLSLHGSEDLDCGLLCYDTM
jgi:hypothetical protein